jgi:hypothetical protein
LTTLNWDDHPFQVKGTFSDEQVGTINELLDYYEGVVFWAGKWESPVDEMHWQMGYDTYGQPRTQSFIDRKIRPDGFSFFRKGVVQPPIERKPVVPGEGGCSWADVSQYQGKPVSHVYPYGVFCFRTNSGDKVDTLAKANAESAVKALEDSSAAIVIPYYFFRPGQENCDLHKEILEDAGLWNKHGTVSMVDVESDGGKISGDQSYEINDEINRLRGWYGNVRRVIGYWNPNADSGLWLTRPYALELVIPQYNNQPGNLSGVSDNIAVRQAFAHQYTDRAMDVPPWMGQGVDMNWSPYTVAELLVLFGLEAPINEPGTEPETPGGPMDLTGVNLEEMCAAIGAQFTA